MDFFQQLKRGNIPQVDYPFVKKATSLSDRLLGGYVKLFNSRIKPMKPLALVNGMPVYDLTQPPMDSQPGARVLKVGFNYMVLKKPARPINMVLMLTPECDMHCTHCSARNYMHAQREPLSFSELNSVVEQFIDLGGSSVVFSGGEPTLHPKLEDLVDRVDKSRAVVTMFTNGSHLVERAADLRSAGLFGTLVSLDSHKAEIHDKRRHRSGAFQTAVAGVEKLRELDMLVGISTYLTHQGANNNSFDSILKLGTELGVQQVFAFDAVPTGALMHDTEWVLTAEDHQNLKEKTKAQNANPDGPAVMGQSWINSSEGFGCFAGFYQLYVTATGEVCPCDFTPISFGNVRDDPLEKIWERMRASTDWGERANECRMQNACFRKTTVDLIPEGTPVPVPYEDIKKYRAAANCDGCAD